MKKEKFQILVIFSQLILFIAIAIAPVIYTINTRNIDDYLYPWIVISVIFVILITIISYQMPETNNPNDDWSQIGSIFKGIIISPIAGILYYSLLVVLYDVLLFVYKRSIENPTIIVPATAAMILGILLFKFRAKQRILYGITEIIAGLTVATSRVHSEFSSDHPYNMELYIAVLTAGIYLVVRGLDNIDVGIKDKSNIKILKWLFTTSPPKK